MNPKCLTSIFAIFLAAALFAGCSKTKESFGPQPPTPDDIYSLYGIPAGEQAHKFVWAFDHAQYVRFVVERAAPKSDRWHLVYSAPVGFPVMKAVIIYRIHDEATKGPGAAWWLMKLRKGGIGRGCSGWSESDLELPKPQAPSTFVQSNTDPAHLFLVETNQFQMRFRIEKGDKPFPTKYGRWPTSDDE